MSELPAPALPKSRRQALRSIVALMLREMSTTYGASPGGYLWAILQPVGMLLVLSFGFALMVRTPSLGSSFFYFYATGFLVYSFNRDIESKTTSALRYSRGLLSYPAVAWIDTVIARIFLSLLTFGVVFLIVMSGVIHLQNVNAILDFKPIILSITLAVLLGLGVGMNNAVLTGMFPMWKNIWSIITRPMLLASGVLYIYEDLPGVVQDILWWNPLIHVTGLMRKGFFQTYDARFVSLTYCFFVGLLLVMTGIILMGKYYSEVLER
jgi:capsular polysaccharide transport system permease protein